MIDGSSLKSLTLIKAWKSLLSLIQVITHTRIRYSALYSRVLFPKLWQSVNLFKVSFWEWSTTKTYLRSKVKIRSHIAWTKTTGQSSTTCSPRKVQQALVFRTSSNIQMCPISWSKVALSHCLVICLWDNNQLMELSLSKWILMAWPALMSNRSCISHQLRAKLMYNLERAVQLFRTTQLSFGSVQMQS